MNPPPPSMPEKPNKKVSRACNTCRLKRKKCDGLDPCLFCTDNKLECSYSREPRRRGPPSGYLRYTETRVALLETLLGLTITKHWNQTIDPFLEAAETIQAESKTCTQDVWDAHKSAWTASGSAKVLEELAMFFAPFHRSDQENFAKPLLPAVTNNSKPHSPSPPMKHTSPPPTAPLAEQPIWSHQLPSPDTPQGLHMHQNSLVFTQNAPHMLSRESFERTQEAAATPSSHSAPDQPAQRLQSISSEPQPWSSHQSFSEAHFSLPAESSKSDSNHPPYPEATSSVQQINFTQENIMSTDMDAPMLSMEHEDVGGLLTDIGTHNDAYTGSYWRTADFALSDLSASPKANFHTSSTSSGVELPPPHILDNLLNVYYQYVYPSFPFLPPRSSLDAMLKESGQSTNPEGLNTMLLALCAYSGRLSPSLGSTNNILGGPGDAGKLAADLWYEQSRAAMNAGIRKGNSVETVQTLLLLALRDHGRGYEHQAWLLVGLAVRMGQDLDLNEEYPSSAHIEAKFSLEDRQTRQNIWGVSLVLDLFLSLQLGRPPAIVDTLRPPKSSDTRKRKGDILASSLIPGIVSPSKPLFAHTVSLCRIISRINFFLYLGFSTYEGRSQSEKLSLLKAELDMWHHSLPHEYRISIGHQPQREVLEVNMLYHVAIILLYRPFSKDKAMHQAADIFLEAASTFNVLLEKYRQATTPSIPHFITPSLSLSNPNMIYLIFTVSIAHLSGFKLRQIQQQSNLQHLALTRSTTMALQTQLHLLNCLEALTSIGGTWELARRCWKTLDKLMDLEGMKPKTGLSDSARQTDEIQLGKRKRDGEGWPRGTEGRHNPSNVADATFDHLPTVNRQGTSPRPDSGPSSNHEREESTLPLSLISWNSSNNGYSNNLSPVPMPMSAEFFDPSLFSSARWLPELSEADSIGLGMVWDGEWDEGVWRQSFNLGLGGGG